MASVNVTVSMTPEMLAAVDREADAKGMSRAHFIRQCIRSDTETQLPMEEHEINEELKTGAA